MPSITKRFIDSAKPGVHYDDLLTGFGVRIGKTGATFFLEYRPGQGGRGVYTRRIKIGHYGSPWTPKQARDKAAELMRLIKSGVDPLDKRQARKGKIMADAVAEWLRRDQADNRSLREVERIMNHDVLPAWGNRPIEDIEKRDVIELIDGIADRGAKVMANRTLSHVRRLFRWAASRDLIASDPAAYVEKSVSETKRDRVLSDDELRTIWLAADGMGYPFGHAVQMLILTAARRAEIFELTWPEIDVDERCIRLPPSRSKSGDGRTIYLSQPAMHIIRESPRFEGGDIVFSFNGRNPLGNASRMKSRLDAAAAQFLGSSIEAWRLHDIRRLVATNLQRLGVRLEPVETVLGHVGGSRSGVVGIYQQHRFENEARAALTAWGERLNEILSGTTSKVIHFR